MADEKTPEELAQELETLKKELESARKDVDKSKKTIENLTAENAEKKRELQAKMSEQERAEEERKQTLESLKSELESLKREKALATSKASFLAIGFSDEQATTASEAWNNGDLGGVTTAFGTFLAEHDKTITANHLKQTPKPPVGGQSAKTREEIMKIRDTAERRAAIAENPTLFGITE